MILDMKLNLGELGALEKNIKNTVKNIKVDIDMVSPVVEANKSKQLEEAIKAETPVRTGALKRSVRVHDRVFFYDGSIEKILTIKQADTIYNLYLRNYGLFVAYGTSKFKGNNFINRGVSKVLRNKFVVERKKLWES